MIRHICIDEYRDEICPKHLNVCCHYCSYEPVCREEDGYEPCPLSCTECMVFEIRKVDDDDDEDSDF